MSTFFLLLFVFHTIALPVTLLRRGKSVGENTGNPTSAPTVHVFTPTVAVDSETPIEPLTSAPTVALFTSLPTAAVDSETPIEPLTSAPTKTVTDFTYPPTAAADSFFQPTPPPTSTQYVNSPTPSSTSFSSHGSCRGNCKHWNSTYNCFCDQLCAHYNDCCLDYDTICNVGLIAQQPDVMIGIAEEPDVMLDGTIFDHKRVQRLTGF